jgi:uncharacterized protein (TIGR02147 family)
MDANIDLGVRMNIFDFDNYKDYFEEWLRLQPQEGHGQLRKVADFIRVSAVVLSQVFRGDRDLTMEQAVGIAKYLGLNDDERDYFLLLVQKARAGTKEYSDIISKQIRAAQLRASELKNRIKHSKFDEKDRGTFYSHWYYSAARLCASIDDMD